MALSRSDETDILASLHAGPLEVRPWQTFLERLRKRLGADRVTLVVAGAEGLLQDWVVDVSPPNAAGQRLIELFGPADPLRFRSLRAERVYALGELVDPSDPAQAAVLRDLLMPAGETQMRILRVTEPGGAVAWLRAARPGADFAAATASLLSSLAPHLVIALRAFSWAARVRRQAASAERQERLAGLGWLSLGPTGTVLDLSPGARHLLAQVPGLRAWPNERMLLPDPGAARALARQLEGVDGPGQSGALLISARPRIELRLLSGPAAPGATDGAVLGLLRQADGPSAGTMVQPLMQLYGLSPSEARLAAELAAGASLSEAAAALSLTIETARTYSKRIFDKTGARGQPDLIRLVLTGSAVLG